MGWFKKFAKAATNPSQAFKDPKQAIKNSVAMGLDPAGSIVRMGTTGNAAPQNGRQMIDPSGKVLMPEQQQAAPMGTYTPRPLTLSPAAQKLYDEMKARTAARNAARASGQSAIGVGMAPPQQAATPPTTSSAWAPTGSGGVRPILQVGAAPAQPQAPVMGGQPAPGIQPVTGGTPRAFADGGKIGGKKAKSCANGCDATYTSKVFDRKPNGKPC